MPFKNTGSGYKTISKLYFYKHYLDAKPFLTLNQKKNKLVLISDFGCFALKNDAIVQKLNKYLLFQKVH